MHQTPSLSLSLSLSPVPHTPGLAATSDLRTCASVDQSLAAQAQSNELDWEHVAYSLAIVRPVPASWSAIWQGNWAVCEICPRLCNQAPGLVLVCRGSGRSLELMPIPCKVPHSMQLSPTYCLVPDLDQLHASIGLWRV